MPDLFYLIAKWWKQMLGLVIIALVIVTAVLLLQPKLYLSAATALRASSYTTDKASVFNRNIEALYSTLGSADDLDMIIGTAQLDTVYLVQADSFNLVQHYNFNGEGAFTLSSCNRIFSLLAFKPASVERLLSFNNFW